MPNSTSDASVSTDRESLAARARRNAIDGRAIIKAGQIIQPTVELIEFFEAVAALLEQPPEPRAEQSGDRVCEESDGCPTELAVLQRLWRKHQSELEVTPPEMRFSPVLERTRSGWAAEMEQDPKGVWTVATLPPTKEGGL